MTITQNYRNAFTEVYKILEILQEKDYNKIPKNVLSVIKENMNTNYEYEINEGIDLREQPMLEETKAILFNIYRDYLTDSDRKQKIINFQNKQRIKLEEEKRLNYSTDNIFKNKQELDFESNNDKNNVSLVEIKKENFLYKVIRKILNIFKKDI